jgi:hypothetical protein
MLQTSGVTIRPMLAAAMARFYAIPRRQRKPLGGFLLPNCCAYI